MAGAAGQFELNVYKPVLIHNLLQSVRLLADGALSFEAHCAHGIAPDRARMAELVARSLMLATALAPHIGYERAAQIAREAHRGGSTLREAALASGWVSADEFDAWVQPQAMLGAHR
jgi:fumarate hydratase class II